MTINAYQKGDNARVSAVFKDANGTAVDPTGLTFKFTTPAGVTTTYTYGTDAQLVKDSTGNYHVDLNLTESGMWYAKWASTGTAQAAEDWEACVAFGGVA